ncbi:MAG TPA: PQQ-binding-like beta-propeller repeat protein [Vicinamibacterales bacterium]|jgi:outer membrane protein assembly factor BamB|nr:PQQ-binding-like beta-propeller repeat protein [Vicinamibacterales bacterium]
MSCFSRFAVAAILAVFATLTLLAAADPVAMIPVEGEGARYWTRWRGPSGQGQVDGTGYVDAWSPTTNLKWKVAVPGRGHSSPIVWKDHLFLTTADDSGLKISLVAYRRSTGALLWQSTVPATHTEHVYAKNSHASATPTTDGQRVYASFGTHGLAAFDFSGKLVWHQKLGDVNNYHGSAGSPVLYKDRLFLYQDHDGSGTLKSFVAAFDAKTGNVVWKKDRIESVGWGTPIVINAGDHDELIVSSQRRVYAYDPATGADLWTVRGNTFEVIPTPVVGHGLVFCSSGRAGPTLAIKPGGKGDVTSTHVAWTSPRGSPFVPSALIHGDLLYMINDMQSILTVLDARTGTPVYQGRLGEATREGFSSSPVAIGDKLFFTNDRGQTFVVQAGPEFKLLHVNELGATVLASPALVDGTWYWRTDRELIAIGTGAGR